MTTHGDGLLVIGIGNLHRGDDAVGLLVARELSARRDLPAGWSVCEFGGDGGALMERWRGHARVVLVDALAAPGIAPGSVRRLDAAAIAGADSELRVSSHVFGVGTAVALAQALGQLPDELALYGIAGGDFAMGADVSPAVRAAVPVVAARILADWSIAHA